MIGPGRVPAVTAGARRVAVARLPAVAGARDHLLAVWAPDLLAE